MSALEAAHYLRLIPRTISPPALTELACEIRDRFPDDEMTPRLVGVIAVRIKRLTRAN
jgi:hypothetical protein